MISIEYLGAFEGGGSSEVSTFLQTRRTVKDTGESWVNMAKVVAEYKRIAGEVKDRAGNTKWIERITWLGLSNYPELLRQIQVRSEEAYWKLDYYGKDLIGKGARPVPANPSGTIYDKRDLVWGWAEKAALEAGALNGVLRERGEAGAVVLRDMGENLVALPGQIVGTVTGAAGKIAGDVLWEFLKALPWWVYAAGGVVVVGGIVVLKTQTGVRRAVISRASRGVQRMISKGDGES